tara:strand:- start:135 stop:650 length:516 start_codon:yes stop_codon:yes gene_type:complete
MNFLINFKEIKKDIRKKENFYCLTLIIIVFLLDRISKLKIINEYNESKSFVNDYINLDLVWNTGIGFGLLSDKTPFFYDAITILIGFIILFIFYILIRSKILDKVIISFIIGGALGNFYDRIVYKAVPDFIDIHYNNFHWFIFNFADLFISFGIVGYIVKDFFYKNKNEKF